MAPYVYDENGRRVVAPSKGEMRERKILDEAEQQLAELGADAMTVETIATAAGLTRGALYFYFRSKNDVLAALVQRVTVELRGAVATRRNALPDSPHQALLSAIDLTRDLWDRHGAVMRAAVELSPTVPGIDHLWSDARDETVRSVTAMLADAVDEHGQDTSALVAALVGMTERVFYDASRSGTGLDQAAAIVTTIWTRTLGAPERVPERVPERAPGRAEDPARSS
ncbi:MULTISPECIES: TetR/AcrR family transcriptional regulator [unclassified Curtobacterium]|uniref:TetR/AcrR family transcriptional regulator n=1 Tax=unclassified Curtobacterium TaxID=257496 RepID=UPI00380945D5